MGDIVNKLNFDTSNQWIFYDERFHKFFDFFANNITDSNILTETEILEQEELLRRNQYVETNEKFSECLQKFVSKYPALVTGTEDDIISLRQSTATMEKLLHVYDELINDMRNILSNCQSKVKWLEELQSENFRKSTEVAKIFAKVQITCNRCFHFTRSPPMSDVIARLVNGSRLTEFKKLYGDSLHHPDYK
uniref:HAUS-augmin3 domain-containing protein n=1 Tax=Glossina pallidipes TaxID=7398 RepID=A0A1A9Z459_GLOPL